jgi:hypothetical protein
VAIFDASATFRQSINQNRAETVVVNETQSLTNVKGVEPVTSSHCALDVPPSKYVRDKECLSEKSEKLFIFLIQ